MAQTISPLAQTLAARVKDGDIIGVGTGSTVDAALSAIGERVKAEKLRLQVVPTSRQSIIRCRDFGLTVLDSSAVAELSWGFDGADEVDPELNLIKGKGGALLQEKILAVRCRRYSVIVDESKLVSRLGERTPVPLEVIPSARLFVEASLLKLGATKCAVRVGTGIYGPVNTEAGNLIIDATFSSITLELADRLKSLVGVVETGLFMNLADEVLVGSATGVRVLEKGKR